VQIEIGRASADDVERILGMLPEWFGIESAVRDYVEYARTHPVCAAVADGRVVGVMILRPHGDVSVELHLLAVEPGLHRQGAGTALLEAAERRLREEGVRLFHVKTLGPSDPDADYARTRAFYEARGFVPMEELPDHWPDDPCLIMVKPLDVSKRGLREDSAIER
jgi:N-acetylglutamate synthase-like GNAT family acetyltransferase